VLCSTCGAVLGAPPSSLGTSADKLVGRVLNRSLLRRGFCLNSFSFSEEGGALRGGRSRMNSAVRGGQHRHPRRPSLLCPIPGSILRREGWRLKFGGYCFVILQSLTPACSLADSRSKIRDSMVLKIPRRENGVLALDGFRGFAVFQAPAILHPGGGFFRGPAFQVDALLGWFHR